MPSYEAGPLGDRTAFELMQLILQQSRSLWLGPVAQIQNL